VLPDKLNRVRLISDVKDLSAAGYADMFEFSENNSIATETTDLAIDPETVKKYTHNPVGILPYFPPNR
jgi:hypothetical protein